MEKKGQINNSSLIIFIVSLVVIIAAIITVFIVDYKTGSDIPKVSGFGETSSNDTNAQQGAYASYEEDPMYQELKLDITDTEPTNVKVTMEDGQSFNICVYPDVAPQSAQNFLNLVREGFYDGLTFHRVIEGFMAQGGDPEGTGMGGSERNIFGEFSANGYDNPLAHNRGVVSMARTNDNNSASSQFFICYDTAEYLDGNYAAFGEVTEGMEVVDSFLDAGTDENDRPLKEVKIAKMEIVN